MLISSTFWKSFEFCHSLTMTSENIKGTFFLKNLDRQQVQCTRILSIPSKIIDPSYPFRKKKKKLLSPKSQHFKGFPFNLTTKEILIKYTVHMNVWHQRFQKNSSPKLTEMESLVLLKLKLVSHKTCKPSLSTASGEGNGTPL